MIEIQLYILLFVYILFLTVFAVLMLINFYHIIMTASLTMTSSFVIFFMFASSFFVMYITWWLLQDVNWQQVLISVPRLENLFSVNF